MAIISPSIKEIINLLQKNKPDSQVMRDIKEIAPALLEKGVLCGPKNGNDKELPIKLKAKAALEGLEIISTCIDVVEKAKKKLNKSTFWIFIGEIVTTIGSASIITAMSIKAENGISYISAICVFLASIANLYSKYIKSTTNPDEDIKKIYESLLEKTFRGIQIQKEIQIWIDDGCKKKYEEIIAKRIEEANEIAYLLNILTYKV